MPHKDKDMRNEYMREYIKKRHHKRRQDAINYLGGHCIDCYIKDNLEFDHKNPKDKDFTIAKLWSISEEKFWLEVDKCVLRCTACHIKKTREENKTKRPWRHGTYWSYQKKCRCEVCNMFRDKINEEIRQKRREKKLNSGSLR